MYRSQSLCASLVLKKNVEGCSFLFVGKFRRPIRTFLFLHLIIFLLLRLDTLCVNYDSWVLKCRWVPMWFLDFEKFPFLSLKIDFEHVILPFGIHWTVIKVDDINRRSNCHIIRFCDGIVINLEGRITLLNILKFSRTKLKLFLKSMDQIEPTLYSWIRKCSLTILLLLLFR